MTGVWPIFVNGPRALKKNVLSAVSGGIFYVNQAHFQLKTPGSVSLEREAKRQPWRDLESPENGEALPRPPPYLPRAASQRRFFSGVPAGKPGTGILRICRAVTAEGGSHPAPSPLNSRFREGKTPGPFRLQAQFQHTLTTEVKSQDLLPTDPRNKRRLVHRVVCPRSQLSI